MRGDIDDIRRAMVARVTAGFADEIDRHDKTATIGWDTWPTVADLIDHLGRNHLWIAEIVRTGGKVDQALLPHAPADGAGNWYRQCRADMLAALAETPADRDCWVLGVAPDGRAGFWTRRLVYEGVKHLMDLRAAGGGAFQIASELSPVDYADGIDELLQVFLPRSRRRLAPLSAPVTLAATDIERRWTITPEWDIVADADADRGPRVSATAGALALMMWERDDPLDDSGRFRIDGDVGPVAELSAARVH